MVLLHTRPYGRHAARREAPKVARAASYLRQARVLGAVAISLLAGVGSYVVTYRVLVLLSEPATTARVAPVASVSPGPSHVPATSAPGPNR